RLRGHLRGRRVDLEGRELLEVQRLVAQIASDPDRPPGRHPPRQEAMVSRTVSKQTTDTSGDSRTRWPRRTAGSALAGRADRAQRPAARAGAGGADGPGGAGRPPAAPGGPPAPS